MTVIVFYCDTVNDIKYTGVKQKNMVSFYLLVVLEAVRMDLK